MKQKGKTMKDKLIAAVEITRPINCFLGSLTVLIGAFLTLGTSSLSSFDLLILPILIYIFIAGVSNVINDYFDIEIDKINRPQRPLPSGRLNLLEARYMFIILNLIAILLTLLLIFLYGIHWFILLIVVGFGFIGYFYAKTGKRLGFIGNLLVGVSFSFGVVFGSIIASNFGIIPNSVYYMFFTSFGMLVSRELVKGIQDTDGDREFQVKTIANLYGFKTAARLAQMFIIVSIIPLILLLSTEILNTFALIFFYSGIAISLVSFILLFKYIKISAGKISLLLKIAGMVGIFGFIIFSIS